MGTDRDSVILAIDQGTTNTKVMLVDAAGAIRASCARSVPLSYPRPGWVEQSAEAIRDIVTELIGDVLAASPDAHVAAIGISNQRETAVLWDRDSGQPVAPAVTWQCTRSAKRCAQLRRDEHAAAIARRTGLGIDPLFPAAKIAGMLDAQQGLRQRAERGEILAGTVDSWLVWNLTGGAIHATDYGNAARTQLFNIDTLQWDEALARLFDVPLVILPTPLPSDAAFGTVATGFAPLLAGKPIRAVMGDSHAALFAHAAGTSVHSGDTVKVTIGTGSSLMVTVPARAASTHGLSSTIAWGRGGSASKAPVQYALEGNISVSGHAAAFTAQMMGLPDAQALSDLAATVEDSAGVVFVPALAGLGAPHWQSDARGTISGMTLATRPAHLARATMEAIAQQICDVIEAMEADLGHPLPAITVDGGGGRDPLMVQMLADLSGKAICLPRQSESSALGAALMAAQAVGLTAETKAEGLPHRFLPRIDNARRAAARTGWKAAVAQLNGAISPSEDLAPAGREAARA